MIWPVLRLVYESRGHKMDSVSEALNREFGGGYSTPTLTRLTKTKEEVPEAVASFVLKNLPPLPGSEDTAEVVRLGLAAMGGQPTVDPAALAAELAAKFPEVEPEVIGAALVAKLEANPEAIARALASKLPAVDVPGLTARLEQAQAALDGRFDEADIWFDLFGSKLDKLDKKLDRLPSPPSAAKVARRVSALLPGPVQYARAVMDRAAPWLAGIGVVNVLGFLALIAIVYQRSPAQAPAVRDVIVTVNPGQQATTNAQDELAARMAGAVPPPAVPAVNAEVLARPMPEKPAPDWLAPDADGKCRDPETKRPLVARVARGACWMVLAKPDPTKSCDHYGDYFDVPPELASTPTLRDSCLKPYMKLIRPSAATPESR